MTQKHHAWTNWARTHHATPSEIRQPRDLEDAARALRDAENAGKRLRVLGSGHSFSAIGSPDGAVALDLSARTGIIDADPASGLVTVHAATPLRQLNRELDDIGLAMANLGDIDLQTLAGALSTGTHGTGARLGGLATQAVALELLTADGTLRHCSAEQNPDLFDAARIGLGALGVITTVTLRCVPTFGLQAEEHPEPLDSVLENFDALADDNDHFEFYWFPYSTHTLVKRNNRLADGAPVRPLHPVRSFLEYEMFENRAFGTLCRLGRRVPALVDPLTRFAAATWSHRSYSDRSHRVFVTSRSVRFQETEFAIPRDQLVEVIGELRYAVRTLEHPVMFPIEVRVAAADDIWLSTAYQRPTAYLAVHQFDGMPYRQLFDTVTEIVAGVGGRPHWGKMHDLTAETLRERYPRFDDFRRVRAELDPAGLFRNTHLDRVLGDIS